MHYWSAAGAAPTATTGYRRKVLRRGIRVKPSMRVSLAEPATLVRGYRAGGNGGLVMERRHLEHVTSLEERIC